MAPPAETVDESPFAAFEDLGDYSDPPPAPAAPAPADPPGPAFPPAPGPGVDAFLDFTDEPAPGPPDRPDVPADPAPELLVPDPPDDPGAPDAGADMIWEADPGPSEPATAAAAPPTIRPSTRRPPAGGKRRGLVFALVAGLAVAAVGVGTAVVVLSGPDAPGPAGGDPNAWYVTASGDSPNPARTLTTLRGVFEQVKSGETIVLLDDRITDPPATLNGLRSRTDRLTGVTVRPGTPGGTVTWAPDLSRTKVTQQGVLELVNVADCRVSGLVIDCGGAMPVGVGLGFACPGTVVENVTVRNPKTAGFVLYCVSGEPDRPARIADCECVAGDKIEAGVLVNGTQSSVRHVEIDGVRLHGPGDAGVAVRGGATGVDVRDCRVTGFAAGVAVSDVPTQSQAEYDLSVRRNTFAQLDVGVRIEGKLAPPKRTVTLTRNYFDRTKEIVPGKGQPPGLKPSGNARNPASGDGKLSPKAIVADGPSAEFGANEEVTGARVCYPVAVSPTRQRGIRSDPR